MKQHITASRLFILTVSGILGSLVGCSPEQTYSGVPQNNGQGGASTQNSSNGDTGGGYPEITGGTSTAAATTAQDSQGGSASTGGATSAGAGGHATGGATSAAATGGKSSGSTGGKASTGGNKATGGKSSGSTGGKAATGGSDVGSDGGTDATGGAPPVTTTAAGNTGTTVTFSANGKATGAMSGWAYVAMGTDDVVTEPTCGTDKAAITEASPCKTGTNWSADGLCVTGTAPPANEDTGYDSWGISIGVDASATSGGTLGQSFSTITYTFSGKPTTGLRAIVSVGSADYCVMSVTSGKAIELTSFAKNCYDATPGTALTAAQVKSITKVMLQVPADSAADITLTNLCLTKIAFGA